MQMPCSVVCDGTTAHRGKKSATVHDCPVVQYELYKLIKLSAQTCLKAR